MTFENFAKELFGIQLTDAQKEFVDFMEWCKENKHTLPYECLRGALFNITYNTYKKSKKEN